MIPPNEGQMPSAPARVASSSGEWGKPGQVVPLSVDEAGNLRISGSVTSSAAAAISGTAMMGKVTAYQTTDLIKNGDIDLQPKFAVISARANQSNTIVSAVSGKKIRVVSGYMMASGTVVAQFRNGDNGTPIGGGLPLTAQTGAVFPANQWGWLETSPNTLLSLHLNSAVFVDGGITYIEV